MKLTTLEGMQSEIFVPVTPEQGGIHHSRRYS